MAVAYSIAAALVPLGASTIVLDGTSPMGFNTFDSYPVSDAIPRSKPTDDTT